MILLMQEYLSSLKLSRVKIIIKGMNELYKIHAS